MKNDPQWNAYVGDLFEIAVKRGILTFLLKKGVLEKEMLPKEWQSKTGPDIINRFVEELAVSTDPGLDERRKELANYIMLSGYFTGQTYIREYLNHRVPRWERKRGEPKVKARRLWAPFAQPERDAQGTPITESDEREKTLEEFERRMIPDDCQWRASADYVYKGKPANADFLVLFEREARGKVEQHLLCLEFSVRVPVVDKPFADPDTHLSMVRGHARALAERTVMAHINAEVADDGFDVNQRLARFIAPMVGRDKPFYKLMQACSYTQTYADDWCLHHPGKVLFATAMAITLSGAETIHAEFRDRDSGAPSDRAMLIASLGEVYRERKQGSGGQDDYADALGKVYGKLVSALPKGLKGDFRNLPELGDMETGLRLRAEESVTNALNPRDEMEKRKALSWIDDNDEVNDWFGGSARERISAQLDGMAARGQMQAGEGRVSLRDVHSAAIEAALDQSAVRRREVSLLCLGAHPGAGKTFSVSRHLQSLEEGAIFAYFSPRLVINQGVIDALTDPRNSDGKTLGLTCNAVLNKGGKPWYDSHRNEYPGGEISGQDIAAVSMSGISMADFRYPQNSNILFVDNALAEEIMLTKGNSGVNKVTSDSREAEMMDRVTMGVMQTLSRAGRQAIEANRDIRRLILTSAVQGFRRTSNKTTTVSKLLELFGLESKAGAVHRPQTLRKALAPLARRFPNIIIMVDEVSGDGAGMPLVKAFADLLHSTFIHPWLSVGEDSPFAVTLIVADASLGNDSVMKNYLEQRGAGREAITGADEEAPPKIIVGKGRPGQPFGIAANRIHFQGMQNDSATLGIEGMPALHIMADAYPASRLAMRYVLNTAVERIGEDDKPVDGQSVLAELDMVEALKEIGHHLSELKEAGKDNEQVLVFMQNRRFLRDLRDAILSSDKLSEMNISPEPFHGLNWNNVAILDSDKRPAERRRIAASQLGSEIRIILMTSSGSRGISFPMASRLVAFMNRFSVTTNLMEIGQFIFRGRGQVKREGLAPVDGDYHDREITFILNHGIRVREGDEVEPSRWIREAMDFLTILLLLRSSVYTRITGDADIAGKTVSTIPIGGIQVDEAGSTLADIIRQFNDEAYAAFRDARNRDLQGLLKSAQASAQSLLQNHEWSVMLPRTEERQLFWSRYADQEQLRNGVCNPLSHASLVSASLPLIPEYTYAMGHVVMESMDKAGVSLAENLELVANSEHHRNELISFRNQLLQIRRYERQLNAKINGPVKDLLEVFEDLHMVKDASQKVRKQKRSRKLWILTPVDYTGFFPSEARQLELGANRVRLDNGEEWLDALLASAELHAGSASYSPAIPHYRSSPWAMAAVGSDITGLDRILSNRFFAATREMNLVNLLLVSD